MAAAFGLLAAMSTGQAANDFWRPLDAGGTWDTVTANWSTTGNNAGTAANFVSGSSAVFGTTDDGAVDAYAISLAGSFNVASLTINTTGYQFTAAAAQTITDAGAATVGTNAFFTLAAGKTVSIGNNVTLNSTLTQATSAALFIGNGSTLNIESGGTVSRTTGTAGGQLGFRNAAEAAGNVATINVAGTISLTAANTTTQIAIGQGSGTASTSGTVNMNVNSGGLITTNSNGSANSLGSIVLANNGATSNLNVGNGTGTGTVTISDTTAQAGLNIVRSGTNWTGTVNLGVGGTITAPRVFQGAIAATTSAVTAGVGIGTFNFNGGTLRANVANANFITGLTAVNVQSGGGTIDNGGFAITIGQALLNPAANGGGGLTFAGASTTTLTGTNTYTGVTTINAGATLQLGNGATGGDGTIANSSGITNNGSLVYNRFGAATSALAIGGSGSVTVSGPGSQTLTGVNTYVGNTAVNGALFVNGSIGSAGTPSGAVSVPVGGRLGGTGMLTVASASVAGTLAPGAGAGATTGTLTVNPTGGLTLSGTLAIALNSTGSLSSGTVLSTGALTLSGATLSLAGTADGTTAYDLVNFTGTLGGDGVFANVTVPSGYTINYAGTTFSTSDIELDVAPVPEPSTLVGGLLLLGAATVSQHPRVKKLFFPA